MLIDEQKLNAKTFTFRGVDYSYVDLPSLCGDSLGRFPLTFRLLLENIVRNVSGLDRAGFVNALFEWLDTGTSKREIPLWPGRLLMHDTTCTPALVDMAGMRDTLAEAGVSPSVLNPVLPVDVSVDHSLAVEFFGRRDAAEHNLLVEMERNRERYRFMRWASKAFDKVRIHPPGTGIMHTINLEQLATVVGVENRDGVSWVVPDVMLGTDSHTPMVNGIGVLGWGVGGLEAQSVMFGMPTVMRIPEVVGVKLTGRLKARAQATDLALTVTHLLRELNVTGDFVEFYGPGVSTLSVGDRSVVANMAPEYGATTGYFGVDEQTLDYLRNTGRPEEAVELVEHYCRLNGLWFSPEAEPRYTRTLEIDLTTIGIHAAGPKRPQDLLDFDQIPAALSNLGFRPRQKGSLPRHPVAIAAVTSCTNTTDPRLLISAGLLARKARKYSLKVPLWVKTSLAPGSPSARVWLERAGLLDDLAAVGFDIVGFGCTTCIGNTGSLTAPAVQAQNEGSSKAVAILSGNRNFPGRVHPDLELAFIMSPALVIAYALSGDAERNLATEPVQSSAGGKPVFLKDLWPTRAEIEELMKIALDPADFKREFEKAGENSLWYGLDVPEALLYPWEDDSTILKRPPFAALPGNNFLGHYRAYPLMVLGDDVTTDHISPASAIPRDSDVADFLVEKGDDRDDLNVFASRRGNWEVMTRATFFNRTLKNLIAPEGPASHTLHVPSGRVMPVWLAAQRYREEGRPVIVVAGERYGMGSSRDWAAKGQWMLGIRAVIASSFERIHRSNLIGMGILPLLLPVGTHVKKLQIAAGDCFEIDADEKELHPHIGVTVKIVRKASGGIEEITTTAAVETKMEVDLLKNGGIFPAIIRKYL
jgi:aconitate hydratase